MPEEFENEIAKHQDDTEEETPEGPTGGNFGALTSPEGVVMLFMAGLFDLMSIICAVLIFLFGIGLLLSKIVYIVGLILFGGWALFRGSGALPTKKKGKGGKMTEIAKEKLGKFFKKHWKKLGAKLIPVFGDIIPYWTITVYEELTG